MSAPTYTRRAAATVALVVAAAVLGAVPSQAATCPTVAPDGTVTPAPASGVDWTGCDLTGADLAGVALSRVTLDDAVLVGADLTGASFSLSSAKHVNLTDATLDGARFLGVDVTGAILEGATAKGVRGVNLTGQPADPGPGAKKWTVEGGFLVGPTADLSNIHLSGVDLADRDLAGVDLTNASLDDVTLDGATLTGATITGLVTMRSSMQGTDLSGATTTGFTRIDKVIGTVGALPGPGWMQVHGALVGPKTYILEADLTHADLRALDLTDAVLYYPDFTGSDVSGVQFAGSYLYMPRFYLAKAVGTRFGGTLISGNIAVTDARSAVFTGGTLDGTGLVESDLTGAIFTGAKKVQVYWIGSTCPDGIKAEKHTKTDCLSSLDTTAPTVSIAAMPTFLWSGYQQAPVTALTKDATGAVSVSWQATTRVAMGGTTRAGYFYPNGDDSQGNFNAWLGVSEGEQGCIRARATDQAGNVSGWSAWGCMTGVTDEGSMDRSNGWRIHSSDRYWGGGYESTSRKGEWFRSYSSGRVRQVGVVAATCPTCGSVAIYVGSTKVGSINLARSTVKSRTLLTLPRFATAKYGKVKVVVTSGSSSTVRIDAVAITGY